MRISFFFLFLFYFTVPAWGMEEMERDDMVEFSGPGWEDERNVLPSKEKDVIRDALHRLEEMRLEHPPVSPWRAFPQTLPENVPQREEKKEYPSWKENIEQHTSDDLQNILDWCTWENISHFWEEIRHTDIPDIWKRWLVLFAVALFLTGWILYLCIDILCFFGQLLFLAIESIFFVLLRMIWHIALLFFCLPSSSSGISLKKLEKLFSQQKN